MIRTILTFIILNISLTLWSMENKPDVPQFVSSVIPVDLIPETEMSYQRNLLITTPTSSDEISEAVEDAKTAVEIVTSEYGKLNDLLNENGADLAETIIITGPIDESDFNALWECATKGNMRTLDLSRCQIKDKTVPDYALYHTVQFDTGYRLPIKKIMLPDDVVRIGKAAFALMRLEEINIPSSLRELGSTAFGYNYKLDCEINIPEGVEEIKYQTFISCINLRRAPKLPSSLKVISEHAFYQTPFDGIEFNEGLEVIKDGAFAGCGISRADLPNSLTEIRPMAFQSCFNLEYVHLSDKLEEIAMGLFHSCIMLKEVRIPDGVKKIADSAFYGCENLSEITFPESLEDIGFDAFLGCNVEKIILPSNLKILGKDAFSSNRMLQHVTCMATVPPSVPDGDAFVGLPANATLFVPAESLESYRAAECWHNFNNIKPLTAGVRETNDAEPHIVAIFGIDGARLKSLRSGTVNILKMSDGTVRKVMR